MNKEKIDSIKNNFRQIWDAKIKITNEFPDKDNFAKNNYRKCWVTCIFIDICGYTIFCDEKNDEFIGKTIRTFHEGILKIMREYGIKDIQIQGDGIFGVVHAPYKNDKNNQKIFDCAMDIKGYLDYFWKIKDFKIGIESSEELMIIVGNKTEREIVFAGGAVNKAKKLLELSSKKTIQIELGTNFKYNNEQIKYWNEKTIKERWN